MLNNKLNKNQIIKGFSSDVFWQITNTIAGFVAVPFILNYISSEIYGYWLAIVSVLTYLGIFDFSIGMSLTHSISSVSRNKSEKLNSLINSGLIFLTILGFLILILGYILSLFVDHIFNIPAIYKHDIIISFRLLILSLAVSLPLSVFSSILIGFNELFFEKNIKEGVRFFGILLSLVLIYKGYGVIGLAISYLFTIISSGIILLLFSKYMHFKELVFSLHRYQKNTVKKLLSYGGLFQFGKIANTISYSADTVIIGIFLFGGEITVYTISSKLVMLIGIVFMSKLPIAFFPTLSKLFSLKEYDTIQKITGSILSYTLRIAIIGSIFIFFGNLSFVSLWVGPEYYAGNNLNIVFISWLIIDAFHRGTSVVIQASGKLNKWAGICCVEAILNIILSVLLINQYGLLGIAISTTIARLITGVYFIKITCDIIGNNYSVFYSRIQKALLFSFPAILFGLLFKYYFVTFASWISLSVFGLLLLVINISLIEGVKMYKSNKISIKDKFLDAIEIA